VALHPEWLIDAEGKKIKDSGVSLYPGAAMDRQHVWNRRKEILIGTQDRVNPTRAMARRASMICLGLGATAAYYFWLVDRIGSGDRTRFFINDAAGELGTTALTIKRYNRRLKTDGWIDIIPRRYQGRNTYAEYVLNPINMIINEDGHAFQERSITPDTACSITSHTAKRALKQKRESPHVLPVSSPHSLSEVAEQAEAVRGFAPRPASFRPLGEQDEAWQSITRSVLFWCRQHNPFLVSCGFKERTDHSICKDILTFLAEYGDPQATWDLFLADIWPPLSMKLPTVEFIKSGRHGLGAGCQWMDR
jgi:hypothetical protein